MYLQIHYSFIFAEQPLDENLSSNHITEGAGGDGGDSALISCSKEEHRDE